MVVCVIRSSRRSWLALCLICLPAIVFVVFADRVGKPHGRHMLDYAMARHCRDMTGRGSPVARVGDSGCFYGDVTPGAALALLALKLGQNSTLVVNSKGGDVNAALDIADYLSSSGVSVVVDGFCLSSCANYIFVAGRRKIGLQGSFVGFHGGPAITTKPTYDGPPELRSVALASHDTYIRALLEKQDRLFAKLHVNPGFVYHSPLEIPHDFVAGRYFWEYSAAELHDRFGVSDIDALPPPRYGLLPQGMQRFLTDVACEGSVSEDWLCST